MATELGKAYVQIMPSAKGISSGIKNVLGAEMGGSTGSALGAKLGKTMAIAAAGAVVAAGIGKIVASSITEGAKLQERCRSDAEVRTASLQDSRNIC